MFLKWSIKNQFCPIIFCWTLVQFSRIRASWEVFNIEVCISVSCMNLVTYKMCKSNDGKRGFKDKMNHREALIPYKASDSFYLTPTKTHSTFKWTKLKSLPKFFLITRTVYSTRLFKQWKVRTISGNRMLFKLVPGGWSYLIDQNK